jgi:CheY-like chemotaxis protein
MMCPMRALVVDDSPQMRFLLRSLLEDAGVEVEEATCGADALERLGRRMAPALGTVVLDQRMPGMTGLEVARELRGRGEGPELVLCSGGLAPALEREAEQLGVRVVPKTDLETLVATVADRAAA